MFRLEGAICIYGLYIHICMYVYKYIHVNVYSGIYIYIYIEPMYIYSTFQSKYIQLYPALYVAVGLTRVSLFLILFHKWRGGGGAWQRVRYVCGGVALCIYVYMCFREGAVAV